MTLHAIYLSSDHAGIDLKSLCCNYLKEHKKIFHDLGTYDSQSCHYPDYAQLVCEHVLDNNGLGILICGTGLGMSMAANRYPGIRAALCSNEYLAQMARRHNNANVLCLGARVLGPDLSLAILETFLNTRFEGGRHQQRISMLDHLGHSPSDHQDPCP